MRVELEPVLMSVSREETIFLTQLRSLKDLNSPYLPTIEKLLAISDYEKLQQDASNYENLALLLELSLLQVVANQSGNTVAGVLKNLSLGTEKESQISLADTITYYLQLLRETISFLISAMESMDYPRLIASRHYLTSLADSLALIMSSTVEITMPTKSSKISNTVQTVYANSGILKEFSSSITTSNGSEVSG